VSDADLPRPEPPPEPPREPRGSRRPGPAGPRGPLGASQGSAGRDATPRLLIAAGGTGGHIYPGLAVARELLSRHPAASVRFVGTPRGLESELVGGAGFAVEMLRAQPLRGGSLLRKLRAVAALPAALYDAGRLLRRSRPDAVVGVGGYLSGPIVLVASWRGIPTLILEPNFEPGLTNRWLAGRVDAVAVAWEATGRRFGDKAFLAGNPVRPEIAAVADIDSVDAGGDGRLRILLFGGSQGSRSLNEAMMAALPLLPAGGRLQITHQTGAADLERVRAAYAERGLEARVEPYLHEMHREYGTCHLVISRAGATTCAELAAAGRGAVLVPLELAGGHQRHNAEALAAAGAAIVVPEAELDGDRLAGILTGLLEDPARCREMGRRARQLARPDAAARIVDILDDLIRGAASG